MSDPNTPLHLFDKLFDITPRSAAASLSLLSELALGNKPHRALVCFEWPFVWKPTIELTSHQRRHWNIQGQHSDKTPSPLQCQS